MKLRNLTFGLLLLSALLTSYLLIDAIFFNIVMAWATPVNTLLVFTFAMLHGGQLLGWKRILLMFGVVSIISLALESYGVATGALYGPYHYNDLLGPKLFGLVPILIPIAWFMMIYGSYLIAELVIPANFGSPAGRRLAVAAISGIVMTAWDLAMDPMMVGGGHWVWEQPGAYFGIPVKNFWGWWFTTFIAVAIFLMISAGVKKQRGNESIIPVQWAIIAYAITGLSTVAVDFIFDLEGPGLVGLFAMLPWIIIGLILASKNKAGQLPQN